MFIKRSTLFVSVLFFQKFLYVAPFFEECNKTINLDPSKTHTFESPKYTPHDIRKRYDAGSSCLEHYVAPHGYIIKANGHISLDVKTRMPNCQAQGQKFFVSRNGDNKLSDADVFCGSHSVVVDSIGHQMSVGYTSEKNGRGRFRVLVKAEKIYDRNCNCGWGLHYKFSKGESSRAYKGLTSTVGVIHTEKDEIVCSGVIISLNYIVSSAHCYYKSAENTASSLQVMAGYKDYPSNDDSFYFATYQIDNIKVHESYADTAASQSNDIALLKMKNPLRFSRGVSPTCLPFKNSFDHEIFYEMKQFQFAGWSKNVEDRPQQLLEESLLSYVSHKKCAQSYTTFKLESTQLCFNRPNITAKYPEYPGSSLFYESGGRKFLIGLFNHQVKSTASQPLVFTKMSSFIQWIKTNAKDEFMCSRFF